MAMDRKGMLSRIAFLGGTALVSASISLAGAGTASAAPGDTIDQQIGHAGTYYNHQLGHLGTFLNHQVGHAGTYYSVQTGRALSGLLNSLLGKNNK